MCHQGPVCDADPVGYGWDKFWPTTTFTEGIPVGPGDE